MPTPDHPLKIGTRGSPLALWQAHEVRRHLVAACDLPEDAFEIVMIKVTGDRIQDRSLRDAGGKGLFTREIEEALLAGQIDIAVHSMKDMPTLQPDGLVIDCHLPRADVRDGFVSRKYRCIGDLPRGAVVGTSSLRRRAQILNRRPDLDLIEFRGNVQTRLRKLDEGLADATFLAMAGLTRLGMADAACSAIEPEEMLPAIAQGAIGAERRADDARVASMLARIHDAPTGLRLTAERAFLLTLDGSCQTPIAGLAVLDHGGLWLRGQILSQDGRESCADELRGAAADGALIGRELAERLLACAPTDFLKP